LWENSGGVGKSGVLEHNSGNISETRKDRENVTMESLLLFIDYAEAAKQTYTHTIKR